MDVVATGSSGVPEQGKHAGGRDSGPFEWDGERVDHGNTATAVAVAIVMVASAGSALAELQVREKMELRLESMAWVPKFHLPFSPLPSALAPSIQLSSNAMFKRLCEPRIGRF